MKWLLVVLFLLVSCSMWYSFQMVDLMLPVQISQKCKPRLVKAMRNSTKPLILYASPFFGNQWGNLKDVYMKVFDEFGNHSTEVPDCYSCDSSVDMNDFEKADIVVYHYPELPHSIPEKYCGQYFVMFDLESPVFFDDFNAVYSMAHESSRKVLEMFDISSTYRLDSDVPVPHFTFWYEQHLQAALTKPMVVSVEERDDAFPVAWIASKCDTNNDRIAYIEELMKHIGVKSYGKCLHNAELPVKSQSVDNEAEMAISKHKFYLAFENSNCQDYITEKFTRALVLGVIPIIMPYPNLSAFIPNAHTAINIGDYDSPQHLATHLHQINKNDTLFRSYLSFKQGDVSTAFKNRWYANRKHRACSLCDLAQAPKSKLKGLTIDETCQKQKGYTWSSKYNLRHDTSLL